MVYNTTEVAKTVVSLLRGNTTLPPRPRHLRISESHLFFFREAPPTNLQQPKTTRHNNQQQQ